MQLNPDKCKELRISFNAKSRSFDPILVNGKELEVATNYKLLGLNINNKLHDALIDPLSGIYVTDIALPNLLHDAAVNQI